MNSKAKDKENKLSNNVPRHIAIVMDGNGRWAKAKLRPRLFGHHKGLESVRDVVKECNKIGVECLTLFAFSSENWRRPEEEVSGLMSLFMVALEKEARSLARNGVRLQVIGDRSAFSEKLQDKLQQVEEMTASGKGLRLVIAANYGGRWDILEAAKKLAKKCIDNEASITDINEGDFQQLITTSELPDPDLFIRTGGERRISNFLMWQLAYTELYFTDVLWPDFNKDELQHAIDDFSVRQRRFGKTGDQILEDVKNA